MSLKQTHLSPRAIGIFYLLVTALGWALAWPAMKVVLREWPPLFARGVAGILAAVILAVFAVINRESLQVPPAVIPRLLLAAFTNVFAWMGFSTLCLRWIGINEGIILVYTMPLWATLLAWPLLGTRPTRLGIISLVLGLSGIAVLLGPQGISFGSVPGVAFALGAAIIFALGAVLNSKPIPLPPLALTAWQVGIGCVPMIALGFMFEHVTLVVPSWIGLSGFIYMTVFSMGVCYLAWFAALRRLAPATASTALLITPLLGIISGALILGEPFGARELIAAALTLGGVTLSLIKS